MRIGLQVVGTNPRRVTYHVIANTIELLGFGSARLEIPSCLKARPCEGVRLNELSRCVYFRSLVAEAALGSLVAPLQTLLACFDSIQVVFVQVAFSFGVGSKLCGFA